VFLSSGLQSVMLKSISPTTILTIVYYLHVTALFSFSGATGMPRDFAFDNREPV